MGSPAFTKAMLMSGAALLISPMCCQRSLSNMGFLCVISVISVLAVTAILTRKSLQTYGSRHDVFWQNPDGTTGSGILGTQLRWWPNTASDAIYGFPMFALSFLCHFNVLPAHEELERPTRYRMRAVTNVSVGLAGAVYTILGIAGFLFAGPHTCGNILLNFPKDDASVIVVRAIFACVLMLNLPLMVLPCRSSFLRLLHICMPAEGSGAAPLAAPLLAEEAGFSKQVTPSKTIHVYMAKDAMSRHVRLDSYDEFTPASEAGAVEMIEPSTATRVAVSLMLFGTAVFVACTLSSVLTIWAIFGSTACFMMAWILPCGFWLRLVGPVTRPARAILASIFFYATSILVLVCTVNTIVHLDAPACPIVEQSL